MYKKHLGQHFLYDPKILRRIAEKIEVFPEATLVEIGPGEGTLTKYLLEKDVPVIAIEKDPDLIPGLRQKFSKEITSGQFTLANSDILNWFQTYDLSLTTYHLIGNIPYYITGQIIRQALESTTQPHTITFVIQREVADRIIALDKKESLLSLSVKAYGTPHKLFTIKSGSFTPVPMVDSALLAIENISRKNFDNREHEHRFFEILRAGFAHKRKKLSSNLRNTISAESFAQWCTDENFSLDVRAEDVPLSAWLNLAQTT